MVDYGDVFTRSKFEVEKSRTFGMIKPDAYLNMGKILNQIYEAGFTLNKLKMSKFTEEGAE